MNNTPLPPIGEIYTYAKIAADAYQLSTHDLQAEDRKQPRAFARQVAMHLAVTHGRHTRDDVAAYFRKQYATVTHAISRVDDELQTSAAFRMLYTNIKKEGTEAMTIDEAKHECASFDGFDDAIIGVIEICGEPMRICYDTEKVIDQLITDTGMELHEATEYFSLNMAQAYIGHDTPAFFTEIER